MIAMQSIPFLPELIVITCALAFIATTTTIVTDSGGAAFVMSLATSAMWVVTATFNITPLATIGGLALTLALLRSVTISGATSIAYIVAEWNSDRDASSVADEKWIREAVSMMEDDGRERERAG
jgi:hypothetical protein